jgi:ABC-2 type transport system permease protein
MLAIFRREIRAYLASFLGYIVAGAFLVLAGIFFAFTNLLGGSPNFTGVLSTLSFVFLFVVPIFTMRLLAEDRRQKTDQLLITSPLSITAIVLGKYLAAIVFFLMILAVTVIYPVIMSFYALGGLGWWEILGGYIGFFLMGAAFISVGLFFSSLTENQIVSAIVTLLALLFMWIVDPISQALPTDPTSGLVFLAVIAALLVVLMYFSTRSIPVTVVTFVVAAAAVVLLYLFSRQFFEGLIGNVLGWFSLVRRYNDFNLGLLSLSPVVYYVSFSGAFVFLSIRVIEKRRWA